jgi:hypothetical protein
LQEPSCKGHLLPTNLGYVDSKQSNQSISYVHEAELTLGFV